MTDRDDFTAAEMEGRLKRYASPVTLRHFRNAKSALGREEWESANAQTRSFLDSLCADITARLWGKRPGAPSAGQARAYLQEHGFLNANESDLLRALFRVLHGEGSHPGTSDRDDSTRRLVMATSLAQYYLDRLHQREEEEGRREKAQREDLLRLDRFAESVLGSRGSMFIMGEYESPDFDTVQIENETVVLETGTDYGVSRGRERGSLGNSWVDEFKQVMMRWGNDYCLVLTERTISEDIEGLAKVDDGLYELLLPSNILSPRSFLTMLVEVPPHSYDDTAADRIRRASDRLAEIIRQDHEIQASKSEP